MSRPELIQIVEKIRWEDDDIERHQHISTFENIRTTHWVTTASQPKGKKRGIAVYYSVYFNWIDTDDAGVDRDDIGVDTNDIGVDTDNAGVDTDYVGEDTDNSGVDTDYVGVHTDDSGVDTDDVGIETDNAGVDTDDAGVDTDVGQTHDASFFEWRIVARTSLRV